MEQRAKNEKETPPLFALDPLGRAFPPLALPLPPHMATWTPPNLAEAPQAGAPVAPEPQRNGRLRVNRACKRCRTHKIKCSGVLPCTNCTRHGTVCAFGREEPPAKVRRTTSPEQERDDNAAYTRYLEQRVRYLENLQAQMLQAQAGGVGEMGHRNDHGRPSENVEDDLERPDVMVVPTDVAGLLRRSLTKWRLNHRSQLALVNVLCRDMYDELSPQAQTQVSVPRVQYFAWNMSGCHYLLPPRFPPPPALAMSAERKAHYVDYFFREINPLYGVVHETDFREQLAASDGDTKSNFAVLFNAMLALVYALSIRFTEFSAATGPDMAMLRLEEDLFQYAHSVVQGILFEWELFELIQCWLLVTLYLRVALRQTSTYNALGRAVHMCRAMDLGRPVEAGMAPYERLKARRIFECVFCIDRLVGFLGGRRRTYPFMDILRAPPKRDYALARDDWLTLPAFAMGQIARALDMVRPETDDFACARTRAIDAELELLGAWLEENGFGDDIGKTDEAEYVLPAVRAQVRLHFYDVVLAVHSRSMFALLGLPMGYGMRLEVVRAAGAGIIRVVQQLEARALLYMPWYTTLLLVFSAAVNCLVFIRANVAVREARQVLRGAMALVERLQDSPVRDATGKLVFRERFKMVRECLWVLKMANHIMSLLFAESASGLHELGIDHGPGDVNKQYFAQFGLDGAPAQDALEKLAHDQNQRAHTPGYGADIVESLRWFDHWLDFDGA